MRNVIRKKMNNILRSLARLSNGTLDEAEGIDAIFLDAVHIRAFVNALDATGNTSFGESYLYRAFTVGATYSIVLKITKLYDRKTGRYEPNTLRKIWKELKLQDDEAAFITSQFDIQNEQSIFQPLKTFRDKCVAHNEEKKELSWDQVDKALLLLARVWHIVGQHSKFVILQPFAEFESVSQQLSSLFTNNELSKAEDAWNDYISKIRVALNETASL